MIAPFYCTCRDRGIAQTCDRCIPNADATARDSARDKFERETRFFTIGEPTFADISSSTRRLIDMRSTIGAGYPTFSELFISFSPLVLSLLLLKKIDESLNKSKDIRFNSIYCQTEDT